MLNYKKKKDRVKYCKSKNTIYGRVMAYKALGLQKFRKAIRHTLCKGIWRDIYIKNCHPTILFQVLKQHKITCKYLQEYVKNREKYLDEVIKTFDVDRDSAKTLFIIILYRGSFKRWTDQEELPEEYLNRSPFFAKFKEEMTAITKLITDKDPDLKKAVEEKYKNDNKKNKNMHSSTTSYFFTRNRK